MQGRILKEKLIDTNGMKQGRSCYIHMLINLKIVSNLQFLVIHFSLLIDYVYICPGMLCIYLYVVCTPRNFIVVVQFSSVRCLPDIIDEEEQWSLVHMSHEGIGTTVEAKAMYSHFGRDKTVSLLISKVFFLA